MNYAPQQPSGGVYYQGAGFRPQQSNTLGVIGLIVSIIGLLVTCGVLCPVGLILSLIALKNRPRGEAVAGTIIGGIGTAAIAIVVGSFLLLTATAVSVAKNVEQRKETRVAIAAAEVEIERYKNDIGTLPEGIEGNKLVLTHTDGWDTPLRYDLDGDDYRIRSAGPDKEFDTGDDILAGQSINGDPWDAEYEIDYGD